MSPLATSIHRRLRAQLSKRDPSITYGALADAVSVHRPGDGYFAVAHPRVRGSGRIAAWESERIAVLRVAAIRPSSSSVLRRSRCSTTTTKPTSGWQFLTAAGAEMLRWRCLGNWLATRRAELRTRRHMRLAARACNAASRSGCPLRVRIEISHLIDVAQLGGRLLGGDVGLC